MHHTMIRLFLIAVSLATTAVASIEVYIADLPPVRVRQRYGVPQLNRSFSGRPLQIGDHQFKRGIGTHANSEITYELAGQYDRFSASVGIDAAVRQKPEARASFRVVADGREIYRSGVMTAESPPEQVNVSVAGVRELKLVADDEGSESSDHVDWAEAFLVGEAEQARQPAPTVFTVTAPGIAVGVSSSGDVSVVGPQASSLPLAAATAVAGFAPTGTGKVQSIAGGGIRSEQQLRSRDGRSCTLVQRFTPTSNSIRWEVEIESADAPWSAGITTSLRTDRPAALRWWTAWADPERQEGPWRDPLVLMPLADRWWFYGNVAQAAPTANDFISLPLVTVAANNGTAGLSLVLSPEDVLLDMTLRSKATGELTFARHGARFGNGTIVRFSMDLVRHESGWRGGLRWMASRYSEYFTGHPRAQAIAGLGAYSGAEGPIDVTKLRSMGFRFNWKLSDDFPYMGMFIPPVRDADERWQRSGEEIAPPDKPASTSSRQLNEYGRWMRQHGFHVLSYFNVTEFGKNMHRVEVAPGRADDPELWRDPSAFVSAVMPNAPLREQPLRRGYYGAWTMDIGDPAYRDLMLTIAKRHIDLLPDTDGLCIDRMDWLRYYNPDADDGVSWVDGRPARSLYQSWMQFMARLGPMMHAADKVIFANTMTMRIELNRHVDGIYDEYGNIGGALNAAALLGVAKPVIGWTKDTTLKDPDAYFQRQLYMGVFPTAPYPYNNHCVLPNPELERWYLDYGSLMNAIRGRVWVLAPNAVEVESGTALANLFSVPGGYVVPVVFGQDKAVIRVRPGTAVRVTSAEALYPGSGSSSSLKVEHVDGGILLEVPLKRGCALVRLSIAPE